MGKELLPVFDEWADTYDLSVSDSDNSYDDYFNNYNDVLDLVANKSEGTVLEFGVGTGNLTKKLLDRGLNVIGIDPSEAMRDKAKEKISSIKIIDGDFDDYPNFDQEIHTIVSTYAFHHLKDDDKNTSISKFNKTLPIGGKVIFADVMFRSNLDYEEAIRIAELKGQISVLRDLKNEYFSTLSDMEKMFTENNFEVSFLQCNKNVWIVEAKKIYSV